MMREGAVPFSRFASARTSGSRRRLGVRERGLFALATRPRVRRGGRGRMMRDGAVSFSKGK